MKILLIIAKYPQKLELNFPRSALFRMKTRVSLKYFLNDCQWKQFFASNSPQNPATLFFLKILVTLRSFTQFECTVREIKLKKTAKVCFI